MRAVTDGRLGVREILHHQCRASANRLGRIFAEGKEIVLVVEDFDVGHGILRVGEVGVVESIDAAVEDGDADTLARDAGDMHRVSANGRHALVQHVILELFVRVDPFQPGQRRDRDELRGRRERRHHREVVELHHTRTGIQDAIRHRVERGPGLVIVDDVDRRVGRYRLREGRILLGSCEFAALVACRECEQRGSRDQPAVHGASGLGLLLWRASHMPRGHSETRKTGRTRRPVSVARRQQVSYPGSIFSSA